MIFRFTLSNEGRPAVNPNVGALNTAQQTGDGIDWTFDTVPDRWEVAPGLNGSKKLAFQIVEGVANADYQIDYDFNVTASGSITIALWDENFFQTVFSTVTMLSSGDYSGTRTLTPDFQPKYLTFRANPAASGYTGTVRTFVFSATNTPEAIAAEAQIISEPDGWEDAILKLERHEDFHSLIEFFEGAFIFYGTNGVEDGGIDFIRLKEQQFGPDATINILIEIAIDDITFETLFTGQIDLSTKEELDDNTMQLGIIREDFWAKFISRLETPVNLQDTKNLDGLPAMFYDSVNLNLLPQRLNAEYRATQKDPNQVLMPGTAANYPFIQFDLWDVSLDEIEEKFNIPTAFNPERPGGLFELTYAGEYRFDIKYCLAIMFNDPSTDDDGIFNITGSWQFDIFIQFNDEPAIQFTQVNFGNNGVDPTATDRWSEFSYIGTHTRKAGDTVRVYADVTQILFFFPDADLIVLGNESGELDWTQLSGAAGPPFGPFESIDTHFYVLGNTEFPESNAEGFLIHDAGAHIADRIIGEDGTFYSEFLGSAETTARQYVSDGCGWFYSLIKGLQLRLYSLLEKPFFMSFKQWWEGANPILNLGLGYEVIDPALSPEVGDFNSAIQDGAGVDWGLLPAPLRWEVVLATLQSSKRLFFEISQGVAEATYTIGYDITVDAASTMAIRLYNATLSQVVSSSVIMGGAGNFTGTRVLTPGFVPRYVSWSTSGGATGVTSYIEPFTFVVTNIPDQTFQAIRVEEKAHFYDDSETSVDFSNVRRISKGYDVDKQFNLVEIGYKKWNADDISGIDDPQTKRNYATIFKKIGKKLSLLSDWIAAGLTIEVTRRTTREKSADYQYDNDIFIVAINPVPVEISPETSPDVIDFEPEQEENFSSVTNLENADTRYNLRLTPARNLLRWMNFISGCLQSYFNSVFKFSSGEGNFDMISQMTDTSPECSDADFSGNFLSEKQDINVSGDYLFLPEPLEITEMPMEYEEYKAIVAKRKKPIGISQTSAGHVKCFIKSLEYKIVQGVADLVVWPKTPFVLQVVDSLPEIGCIPVSETPDEDCVLLTESGENMLTEANTLLLIENCSEPDEPNIIEFAALAGSTKWQGSAEAGGYIYAAPFSSTSILKINTTTNEATTFGSLSGGTKWAGAAKAGNGKIYCSPSTSQSILKIDPSDDSTSLIGGALGTGDFKWIGGIVANNGKIYFIPHRDGSVLVLDPSDDSFYTFGSLGGGNKWVSGVLAPNGKIYCIPFDNANILVIDPSDDSTYTISVGAGSGKWNFGCLSYNNKIYCVPRGASNVLVIDPSDDSTYQFSSIANNFYDGSLAPNGKIYCPPIVGLNVLEIDPITEETALIPGLSQTSFAGGMLGRNGQIYGIPYTSTVAFRIEGVGTITSNMYTFPGATLSTSVYNKHMNKF